MIFLYYGVGANDEIKNLKYKKIHNFSENIDTEKAREIIDYLTTALISTGDCVVIGPIDEISDKVSDIFLKTLEKEIKYDIVLWCNDIYSVRDTIRSRAISKYCFKEDILNVSINTQDLENALDSKTKYKIIKTLEENKDSLQNYCNQFLLNTKHKDAWRYIKKYSLYDDISIYQLSAALFEYLDE